MSLDAATREKIESVIHSSNIVLFMKGSALMPQCGFSGLAVDLLKKSGLKTSDFKTFNILEDDGVRQGLKIYSNWPTFPQLYVRGELVGGADILREMYASGELQKLVSSKTV